VRLESPGVLGPTLSVLSALLPGGSGAGGLACPLLLEAAVLQASPHLSRRPLIHHQTFVEEVMKVG